MSQDLDPDLFGTARRDQTDAGIRDIARMIAKMEKGLRDEGVTDDEICRDITGVWARRLIFGQPPQR